MVGVKKTDTNTMVGKWLKKKKKWDKSNYIFLSRYTA